MNKMNKKAKKGNAGIVLFLIALAVVFFLFILPTGTTTKDFLEVRMYDSNGNLIGSTESFAVVNDVPGVDSVDVTINVENTGEIPLSMSITSLSPTQFNNAVSKTTKTVQPGNSISWTSNLISVGSLGLGTKTFSASVRGTYDYAGQTRTIDKSASISITIEEDLTGDFILTIESGGESSGIEGCPITVKEDCTTCELTANILNGWQHGTNDCGMTLTMGCMNNLRTTQPIEWSKLLSDEGFSCGAPTWFSVSVATGSCS